MLRYFNSIFRLSTSGIILLLFVLHSNLEAQKIEKFEQLNVLDGLSQNYVQSILCDHKGFMWFGTWDGLNRYDGRQFKVFKVNPNQQNTLTNNRIIDLWQDKQNTLWTKTNDDYIHYFVEATQEFITYPYYLKSLEEKNSTISCFTETDQKEIFLGSTRSGMYYLRYDKNTNRYIDRQFVKGGTGTLSSNAISFILNDTRGDVWVGTKQGLSQISKQALNKDNPNFSNYWPDDNFTVGFLLDSILLFGTEKAGIKKYETGTGNFEDAPEMFKAVSQEAITLIDKPYPEKLLVGTKSSGLFVFDLKKRTLQANLFKGKEIRHIYRDFYQTTWINTQEFGIYSVDSTFTRIRHYDLVPAELKCIVDDERQFIYEDSNKNFWIGLHTGGLAQFNRNTKEFDFHRHVPNDNNTISSDNVYCIAEDQNGLLWVGTGPADGGVNKIYTTNKAFQLIRLEEESITGNENVVRSILVDRNKYTWVGTKEGSIYILDEAYKIVRKYHKIPLPGGLHPLQNAYTMMQDKDGFIWIGTKGGGVFVSEQSLDKTNYENLRFINYLHNPEDPSSLSSNIIYSIFQDSNDNIWIGSYGGGLNLITGRNASKLNCIRYNPTNSGLSSDLVRNITEDHSKKLWIATAFGLNYLDLNTLNQSPPVIHSQLYDPRRTTGLSYNDVIHIFNDSKDQLWIGTSGGGINKLNTIGSGNQTFTHLTTKNGLVNDVVYAIAEDAAGHIWFSTDNGLSRYNMEEGSFNNFDQSNNLGNCTFNENTCSVATDGNLLFGTNGGLLIVKPGMIKKDDYMPPVVLTNFQLFNKNIDIRDPDSPIKHDIETLDEITLTYLQSSFSIEYAALSYYAPTKNKYAFMLENFDESWNEVGNQNKATYTNLAPGKYLFKVKAANWNSDWSNKTREITIIILPPWWKTNILYFIYIIVSITLFEIIRRSYVKYNKLQNDLRVEKRVNDIKLQFFTNISHEIRTPLTLILGPIQDIIETNNVSLNISNRLHLVEKNAKRMLRLVNQLLDFRKIQKNKMILKVHTIELISFIRSIIENFNLIAEHKNITVDFDPGTESLDVWVDPNKFDSVIFNILSNALKFSPGGSNVSIFVTTGFENYVDIAISDRGAGIPTDKMNLIFQKFSPLSEANTEFGSSGIGLAFSYQIMKLHHGDIIVKSGPNKGSTFIIRLLSGSNHFTKDEIQHDEAESSYETDHEKEIEEEEELSESVDVGTSKKENHVLIVEDNVQVLNYLKESLQKNYNISTAFNGQEALTSIMAKQPDVIVTDIMMPVMDGIALTRQLKNSIDTSHIPVIMLTAKSAIEDQVGAVESGAEAYILKPFKMAYVHAVISNLIRQRRIVYRKFIQNKDDGNLNLKITTKDNKFLHDVMQLIMDHHTNPEFNVEKLAEMSYVSRTVFYNKIKSLTGLTPIDFLRQKRLHIAAQMILETDYNVSEIAVITGFNDVKNFSKRFRELYKLTPSQYRQTTLKDSKLKVSDAAFKA